MSEPQKKITVIEGKPVYDYRAFYRKEGRQNISPIWICTGRFSGHFRRAKLPVWYTLGFNPHVYLTYALPLALGYEVSERALTSG